MNKNYAEIKLTKRKKTFAVLAPTSSAENPEAIPEGCKQIVITDSPEKK